LAKEFGDKAAIRRAYSNLGNAHVFLGDLEKALDYYRYRCWQFGVRETISFLHGPFSNSFSFFFYTSTIVSWLGPLMMVHI
jgi:hypothetical protein